VWVAKRRCQPDAAAELWRIRDPERLEGAAVWRKPMAAMEIFLLVLPVFQVLIFVHFQSKDDCCLK
jgi:hypothetical protein